MFAGFFGVLGFVYFQGVSEFLLAPGVLLGPPHPKFRKLWAAVEEHISREWAFVNQRDSSHGLARTEAFGALDAVPALGVCNHSFPCRLSDIVLQHHALDLPGGSDCHLLGHSSRLALLQPQAVALAGAHVCGHAQHAADQQVKATATTIIRKESCKASRQKIGGAATATVVGSPTTFVVPNRRWISFFFLSLSLSLSFVIMNRVTAYFLSSCSSAVRSHSYCCAAAGTMGI